MAIHTLLFFALSLSITYIMFADLLIRLSNQKLKNSPIMIAVQGLHFFLIPFNFTSAIILLLIHVAIPQSAYINHLTMATEVLVSGILLFGTPLVVHMAFTDEEVTLYTVKFMLIVAAATAMYKYNPYNRCINYIRQTAGNLVLAFTGLCISAGAFLITGSYSNLNEGTTFVPIPIGFLFFSLNYLNFLLSMVLLFLHISVPNVPAAPIGYLVEAVVLMSSNIVLIGVCMIVELLDAFM